MLHELTCFYEKKLFIVVINILIEQTIAKIIILIILEHTPPFPIPSQLECLPQLPSICHTN